MKNKKIIYVILGVLGLFVIFFAYKEMSYKPIESINYFKYSYFGGWNTKSNVFYEIECSKKCKGNIKLGDSDYKVVSIDDKTIKKLIGLLNKYNVSSWNGYNRRSSSTDLASFSLEIATENNRDIKAEGYGYFPNNHDKFKEELNKILG